jgi:hypothetical protein
VISVVSFAEMIARDTSPAAAELQYEVLRRFTPAQRLRMAFEMSEFARSLSRAGLRRRRPELDERQLDTELIRMMYGVETAARK